MDVLPSERTVLSRKNHAGTRRVGEWPYFTIALSIVMFFVLFLSTPWGTPLRESLLPGMLGTDPATLKEKSDHPSSPDKDISLQKEDLGALNRKTEHDLDNILVVTKQPFEEAAEPEQIIEFQVLVNFVGFVGNKDFNDADGRGYEIRPDDLLRRHSVDHKGNLYRVEATVKNQPIAGIFVRILPRPDIE